MVDWTDSFICSICKTSRQVVDVLDEGIDPDTKNPFTTIEMDCGHKERRYRVTKELTLRWKISKAEKEILKEIDMDYSENERQEIKNILEEIKNDLKSKRIPDSTLEKLKRFEKI